jgi:hypothetical protein
MLIASMVALIACGAIGLALWWWWGRPESRPPGIATQEVSVTKRPIGPPDR